MQHSHSQYQLASLVLARWSHWYCWTWTSTSSF